jgi:hypothetical protein
MKSSVSGAAIAILAVLTANDIAIVESVYTRGC